MLLFAGKISSFADSATILSKLKADGHRNVDESTVVFQMDKAHSCSLIDTPHLVSVSFKRRVFYRALFAVSAASMQMWRIWPRERENSFLYKQQKIQKTFGELNTLSLLFCFCYLIVLKDLDKIECILNDGCTLITYVVVRLRAAFVIDCIPMWSGTCEKLSKQWV